VKPSACLLLLLAVIGGRADPAVRLPAEVKARPGRLVKLAAESDGKLVRWASASEDADLIPFPDGRQAIFSAAQPGRYRVLAWTAVGDVPSEAAVCTVVVDGPTPPPPPSPNDPLAEALRAAYAADPSPQKSAHRVSLAALYRQAATTCRDPDVKTAGNLFGVLKSATAKLVPDDALTALRQRVAEELRKVLPLAPDAALEPAARGSAAQLFAKLAAILEGLS
jgi:hypothetical protein